MARKERDSTVVTLRIPNNLLEEMERRRHDYLGCENVNESRNSWILYIIDKEINRKR